MDEVGHDESATEPQEDHPAGDISLPGRIKAEAKILTLVGIAAGATAIGALGTLTSSSSISVLE